MYFPPLDAKYAHYGRSRAIRAFLPTSFSIAICKGDIGNAIRLTLEQKHHSLVIYIF
jgi:hypothetical protein